MGQEDIVESFPHDIYRLDLTDGNNVWNAILDCHMTNTGSYNRSKSQQSEDIEFLKHVVAQWRESRDYSRVFDEKVKDLILCVIRESEERNEVIFGKENHVDENTISEFDNEYRFLSNFWYCEIEFGDDVYPSVEHAYQAAKSLDYIDRRSIRLAKKASNAKKIGRQVKLRSDWEEVKVDIMRQLLRKKFNNPTLKEKLLATGRKTLIEGNWWGDKFWGIFNGEGENMLGKLLMEIREELS